MADSAPVPATPRPAATVMVVRPAAEGFEVFMVRRPRASAFAADVFVFPGGSVRPDDAVDEAEARQIGLDPAALHAILVEHDDPFAGQADGGLALWVAALRELFEEAGLLLAEEAPERLLDLSEAARAAHFARLRTDVQEGRLSLAGLARSEGLRLSADRLAYFSRWITPVGSPRRFDARFFLAEVPTGQTAAHCQIETTDGLWIAPRRALAANARREFPLMFVTLEHVKRLAEFRDSGTLLEFSRDKPICVVRAEIDSKKGPYLTPEQGRGW